MQNKIRQGDTKKAVLINMCLPKVNNKLLEICKREPNNTENTELVFFKKSVQEQSRYTNCKRTKAKTNKLKKSM